MSGENFEGILGELIETEAVHMNVVLTFSNIRATIIAVIVIIFAIRFMIRTKPTPDPRRKIRRKYAKLFDNRKLIELKNRSVDIKDFAPFKPSEVENITMLNTLINANISRIYNDVSNSELKTKAAESSEIESKACEQTSETIIEPRDLTSDKCDSNFH
eukprot:CAMPEP_0168331190 /NCGR_PEP_ID=MMETSP0213-20121227/8184_1 /TAXON_ID=151035 /ORGANISM="Euplotes harpa, Strain FSP1.4" /LENGTH=158 /DNA_ID=CAMNT_0008334915 /DNA_START=12 /DNA_END=488 /DNA_ORIENTATION=+